PGAARAIRWRCCWFWGHASSLRARGKPTAQSAAAHTGKLSRLAPERIQTAGVDQFARQLMPDDLLRQTADLDQRVEVDTGLDAHLLAQQDQFLRADVARSL